MIKKQLEELEKFGREACALAYNDMGTGWNWITPHIRAYTADSGNHQSAELFGINISFFSETKFDLRLSDIQKLDRVLRDTKKELSEYRQQLVDEAAEALAQRKRERVEALKRELEELEDEE